MAEGRGIYYLDVTWINEQTHDKLRRKKCGRWPMGGWSTGLKIPFARGRRLILTSIGNESRFLNEGMNVFISNKTGEYHKDMNLEVLEQWSVVILEQMVPGFVIVVDNAPYYYSRRSEQVRTHACSILITWLIEAHVSIP